MFTHLLFRTEKEQERSGEVKIIFHYFEYVVKKQKDIKLLYLQIIRQLLLAEKTNRGS